MRTTPPGGAKLVVLYDGHCRICTRGMERLARIARRGAVDGRSFQEPGALDAFPGVTHEACMERLHVIAPDGRVWAGAEAIARVLTRAPFVGWLAFLYYVPGVRQLAELGYRVVANNRYAFGRADCPDGACALHAAPARARRERAETR